jgi:23S rRNA (cytosine1962-C5)-methyltransferase
VKGSVTLRKHEERRIADGHLWAFSNEIHKMEGDLQAGDLVRLLNHTGKFIGVGFYHPHSLIAVRVISRKEEQIDFQFFHRRIESALALRTTLFGNADAFRLVHGESDFLPGLVVDKYGDELVVQMFSAGMEQRSTLICDVLDSLFHPRAIIERNESGARLLEGLEQRKGILRGASAPVTISEHGLRYAVDLLEGQKTGFFLDQRENRKAIRRYAKGADVLDCFCNDGGFAMNAATGGAAHVTAVDVSETAISRAAINADANNLNGQIEFTAADGFEYLRKAAGQGKTFGVINLDPPSFAKNKKSVTQAKIGYKELHTGALKILNEGGILLTACCSHHIHEETFLEIIMHSANSLGKNLSLLEWRGAAPDHPVLPAMPETHYLKFGVFRVTS